MHFKIGREYNIQMFVRDNKMRKDMSTKCWLQHEALRGMPPQYRAKAEIVDTSGPPYEDRPYPIWDTPPIKDFDVTQYVGEDIDHRVPHVEMPPQVSTRKKTRDKGKGNYNTKSSDDDEEISWEDI